MGPAAAALIYAGVTALLFRTLLPDLSTHLYAYLGDPLLNAAILAWNASRVPLTEAWWNFPGYAPLTGVTAFTEHLLLAYPIASPLIWITGNPVLAYNVVYILSFPLNGLCAYVLARELTGEPWAALVGGLAFAFAPYQGLQMTHLQMLMAFGIPLTLLGLHRAIGPGAAGPMAAGRRRGGLAIFAGGWLCAALANAYNLVFVPLLVALWVVWFVRPREWRTLVAPATLAVVVVLLMAPLLWGYHVRQSAHGLARQYDEVRSFAADMTGVAHIFHRSPFWRGVLPETFEEGAIFPGFTIAALAIVAVVGALGRGSARRGRPQRPALPTSHAELRMSSEARAPGREACGVWSRRLLLAGGVLTLIVLARVWTGPFGWHFGPLPLPPFRPYRVFTVAALLLAAGLVLTRALRSAWARRDVVVFYGVAVVALWLLALGPEPEWSTPWRALIYGPYRLLMEVPGVQGVRVPARAWLAAIACLSVLASFGAAALVRRAPRGARVAIGALAVLMVAEGWFSDVTVAAPRPMPPGIVPAGALVIDMPVEESFWNAIPQYRAVVGGYRTINGYSGYEPPHFTPLRHAIAEMRPDAFEPFRRTTDLYVMLRPGETPAVASWVADRPGAQHLLDVGQTKLYRLPRLGGVDAP